MIEYEYLSKPTRLRIRTPIEMIRGSVYSHTHKPLWFDFHVGRGKKKTLYTKITDQTGLARSEMDARSWLCLELEQLPWSCSRMRTYLDESYTHTYHNQLLSAFKRHTNQSELE